MKIGTLVIFSELDTMKKKLIDLKQLQFDNCQLLCWNPELLTRENAFVLKALFAQYGVTISAFWCGWSGPKVWDFYQGPTTLGLVPAEYREERVAELCKGADFAKTLGITDVITHMGFIPEDPNDPNFPGFCSAVRTVAAHMHAQGQRLLFETGQETPVAMLRCFEVVDMPNLGVNLDTANLILYGKANPLDALDILGPYVRNIHAKDGRYPTNGHDLGEETPLGKGCVDFDKLIQKLKILGYSGYLTIEREIDGEEQIRDILQAREYLQRVLNQEIA